MKDYYELLEVNKSASEDTIKKVFRILIKKNHPDLFDGKEKLKAEEKCKELNEAYEVLINKETREKYDLELEENSLKNEFNIQELIEENEHLRNMIRNKNKMIKEFLEDAGINANINLDDDIYTQDTEKEITPEESVNMAYREFENRERIKSILFMTFFVVIGIIVLNALTGINIFKIIIDIFKTMF